ncbi:hypothetical protein BC834DRAFT_846065 [Gloeopeniophorella convolvens]|nr:hypothetical protein BC834DRAFT_846065 [Gloeopeniophorella convolvens]
MKPAHGLAGTLASHIFLWPAQEVKSESKGKTSIIVPFTNSLYLPNKLRDAENVIIDVGTGYYVQKAVKHYEQKIDFIKSNLDTLQETIQKKQENMNYLVSVIQSKPQAQRAGNNIEERSIAL